ncbi:MAG: Gldg family protein, partial [Myxococcota bacterium]
FLVLQGLSLWTVVEISADPTRPTPVGAVLQGVFGGTLLWWVVVLVVIAALAMRLIAEDRRSGTWETLLTTPVGEGAAVLGKWLGAMAFFALLWLPTLLYPLLLSTYLPADAPGLDPGPIAAAYAGTLLCGAALLALGTAASAATSSQIVAALLAFTLSVLLLAGGQLAELAPQWTERSPHLATTVAHIDIRGHLAAMAGGTVSLAALVFFVSLAAVALHGATALALVARRRPAELAPRFVATALLAVIAVCGNIQAARHGPVWDLTADRINSLSPRTAEILARVADEDITARVLRAELTAFAEVQDEIERILGRMVRLQPRLRVEFIEPTLEPGRIAALADEFATPVELLRDGGVVLFQRGARRRAVDLFDIAEFAVGDQGAGRLSRFRAEEAFAAALFELLDPDRPIACYLTRHGAMALAPPDGSGDPDRAADADAANWFGIGARLGRDGIELSALDRLDPGVPARCRVLIAAGPRRSFSPDEAIAIDRFLSNGGRMLLALAEPALSELATAPTG